MFIGFVERVGLVEIVGFGFLGWLRWEEVEVLWKVWLYDWEKGVVGRF